MVGGIRVLPLVYQFMPDTYAGVSRSLGLEDFSQVNQDVAALALIDGRGALDPFLGGKVWTCH